MPRGVYKRPTYEELFWSKVKKTDGCWVWQTGTSRGYGRMSPYGKHKDAHRFSFELHYGKIRNDLCVLHKCDNRLCVNPSHLFLGTRADNQRDMRIKGRGPRGEKNARSKLTKAQVKIIRSISKETPVIKIAGRFKISSDYVYQIRNRDRWAWL